MTAQHGSEVDYEVGWSEWDDMKAYGPMSLHTRRLIWEFIGDLDFRSVLDVGCGQGSPLEQVARKRPDVELAGVDISERAVQLARQRLPHATFSVLDLTREHLGRTFDLIVCSDVVEHIEDHQSALRNMRAMTGRWCLVATLQGRMRSFEPEMGHVRNYRRGELASLMREAGFRIVRQAEWGFPLYSPLYRDLLERVPPGATTGEFGPGRIVLSRLIYYAFFLNTYRFGDYVFCLGAAD